MQIDQQIRAMQGEKFFSKTKESTQSLVFSIRLEKEQFGTRKLNKQWGKRLSCGHDTFQVRDGIQDALQRGHGQCDIAQRREPKDQDLHPSCPDLYNTGFRLGSLYIFICR